MTAWCTFGSKSAPAPRSPHVVFLQQVVELRVDGLDTLLCGPASSASPSAQIVDDERENLAIDDRLIRLLAPLALVRRR
jgi:hypothetical protein